MSKHFRRVLATLASLAAVAAAASAASPAWRDFLSAHPQLAVYVGLAVALFDAVRVAVFGLPGTSSSSNANGF